jgi:hypothetical protein
MLWADLKFSGFFTMAGKHHCNPSRADDNHENWSISPSVAFRRHGEIEAAFCARAAHLRHEAGSMSFGRRFPATSTRCSIAPLGRRDRQADRGRGDSSTKSHTLTAGRCQEIYVMDYDGYDPDVYATDPESLPTWSRTIEAGFVSYRQAEISIRLRMAPLPFPIASPPRPCPSPGRRRLAFTLRDSSNIDIHVKKLDDQGNTTSAPSINPYLGAIRQSDRINRTVTFPRYISRRG